MVYEKVLFTEHFAKLFDRETSTEFGPYLRASPRLRSVMNIIILEDDPLIATHISHLVEECGNHVSGVTGDAEMAVSMAVDLRPDLMIADIDLGAGGDGVEAAISVREQTRIKSIFLTGSSDYATRDRAQAAWPLNFITKPFSRETFSATLAGVGKLLEDDLAKRYTS